jgi:tRNA (adenine37-N6)-methyltransferase
MVDRGRGSSDEVLEERLLLRPIGYVRSGLMTKVQAARQPVAAASTEARIELLSGHNFEHALEDLDSWELIWVLFWFHRNSGWRPKVLPPRSSSGRKGVFATRAPHRPNPIGMSVVRLLRIENLTVHVSQADMLDGTPVLDIKPYVAYSDAHPGADAGWLKDQEPRHTSPQDPQAGFEVSFEPLADEQASWVLRETGLALRERIEQVLKLGPTPHPYRRIKAMGDWMQLAVKEWRVRFAINGRDARVFAIDSGYRDSQLARRDSETLSSHRAYLARWPRTETGGAADRAADRQ